MWASHRVPVLLWVEDLAIALGARALRAIGLLRRGARAMRGVRVTRVEGGVRPGGPSASDRGDVPGWVLITLMTAGLVVVLWAAASVRLEALFDQAMDSVVAPGG